LIIYKLKTCLFPCRKYFGEKGKNPVYFESIRGVCLINHEIFIRLSEEYPAFSGDYPTKKPKSRMVEPASEKRTIKIYL